MAFKSVYGALSELEIPAVTVLGQLKDFALSGLGKRPAHLQRLGFEVFMVPFEGQQLAFRQLAMDRQHVEGFEALAGRRLKKCMGLVGGEGTYLFLRDFRAFRQ